MTRSAKHGLRVLCVGLAAMVVVSLSLVTYARHATESTKDIVDTAMAAGQFKTLATALQAAGLVNTLKSEGPFTVFAPTDEAFAKLPAGTVEDLLKPENKEKLISILTYHVAPGKMTANEVANMKSIDTLNGHPLAISNDGGTVKVNEAKVTQADIHCSNGVIHVIDSVLLPQ